MNMRYTITIIFILKYIFMLMWSLYLDLHLTETLSTSPNVASSIPCRSDVEVRDISLCKHFFGYLQHVVICSPGTLVSSIN